MIEIVKILIMAVMLERVLSSEIKIIGDNNFTECLQGEWMLEFYAPWCPACRQFTSTWRSFAESSSHTSVNIAMIDVTQNSVTAGRFMIMALPSIMYINEGVVRPYKGARSVQGLQKFVDEQLWHNVEPFPWYSQPTSIQMYLVGYVYWGSQRLTEMQKLLMEEYKLSPVTIVIIVGVATILAGCLCGGVLVGLSELWNRYRSPVLPPQQQQLPQQQPEEVTMDTEEKVTKETANEDIGDRSDVRKRVKTADQEQ